MPIRVPDTYQRRHFLPGSLNAPKADIGSSQAVGRAIVGAGQIIEQRALELKRERDETIALNAYNEFQDAARIKMRDEKDGFLNQTGESIYNLDDQYKEWFGKFKSDYMAQRFDTDTQAAAFERMVDAHGQRDLDSISRHIMVQHGENKKRAFDNFMAGADAEIRENPAQIDEITEKAIAKYNTIFPGDNEVQERIIAGRIASAAVQEMIEIDPTMALEMIESRKGALGAAYTDWKNKAEAAQKVRLINDLQAELQAKYELNGVPNFAKMRQDLTHKKGIARDVKFEVRKWLDAYQTQYESNATASTKEAHDQEELAIGRAYLEGDYTEAVKLLRESRFLPGNELKTWVNSIKEAKKEEISIDPDKEAAELVIINRMIRSGLDADGKAVTPQQTWSHIIQAPVKRENKEQYINKLESKLEQGLKAALRMGEERIEAWIIPMRSDYAKLLKAPIESQRVLDATRMLHEWVNREVSAKRYPTMQDIDNKAKELGRLLKPSQAEVIEDIRRERAIQKAAE